MEQNLFRKKSLEKINSPESLNDYIRVSNPAVWLIIAAVIVLLAGAFIWGAFGHIDTTVSSYAVVENGEAVCYVAREDISSVEKGMNIVIDKKEGIINKIGMYNEEKDSYEVYADIDIADGSYDAKLVTESDRPISFIFN